MSKVLDSFCRTCMVKVVGQTNQIIASYHIFQTEDFAPKFTQCTNLQVHPDDEYPSSVCENCLANVLSLYHFQIMCRDSIDKFSSMLVENKPEPEISYRLGNNNSSEFLSTMDNQVVMKCEPELNVVVDPVLAHTNSQLAEIELQVEAGITGLQLQMKTRKLTTVQQKKLWQKKTKSHEKGSQDKIHCNKDEDKLENSSDEEEFNTDSDYASSDSKAKTSLSLPFQCATCYKKFRIQPLFEAHMRRHQEQLAEIGLQFQEPTSSNNRKSKRSKHLNRSSKAGITDLKPTNENQQTDDETTTKNIAKKAKSHEKNSQDEIHCNVDEVKLENFSDEEGKLQIPEPTSSNNQKSKRVKHLNTSSKAGITDLLATNENQQTDDGTTTKIMAKKAKSHEKHSQDEIHCNVDEDKLENFSDEEGKLQLQKPTSNNNRKSKRAKHLNRPSKAGVTDLQSANENQQTDDGTKIHCNEDEDKLENFSDEEWFNTDSDCASPDSKPKTSWGIPFQCDTCPKTFRFQHSFEAHMRRHQRQRGYPCTRQNCERSFNRLSYLQQHLNDHDGIPRTIYKCEFKNCQQSYVSKCGLRQHKRKNHSGKPITSKIHMCETCGTVYATPRSLREHRFIHIDKSEWPFVCDVEGCSKRFRILYRLKIHQKRHAGIKNYNEIKRKRRYQCSFCDKAFFSAADKKYHEMIHTGEKPHVCDECGTQFRQLVHLKTHMRTHIKERLCLSYMRPCIL